MNPKLCCFSCDRLYKFEEIRTDEEGFYLLFKQINGIKEDYLYEQDLKIWDDGSVKHPSFICVGPNWKIIQHNVPEPPRDCLRQLEWWVLEEGSQPKS